MGHSYEQGIFSQPGEFGQSGEYDNPAYRGGLYCRHSSSVHGLRLPLTNQGRTQCGEDVIHIICVRHNDHHGQDSKQARSTSVMATSVLQRQPRHPRAGTVVPYVEHSTIAKTRCVPRRVPRHVPRCVLKRISQWIEGNIRYGMR